MKTFASIMTASMDLKTAMNAFIEHVEETHGELVPGQELTILSNWCKTQRLKAGVKAAMFDALKAELGWS